MDQIAPEVVSSIESGTFGTEQMVSLTCSDEGGSQCDEIYYTLDGTEPNESSSLYTGEFTISNSSTLQFIAMDEVGNSSEIKTINLVIDFIAPETVISLEEGIYSENQLASLSCEDQGGSNCQAIYYTLDGNRA